MANRWGDSGNSVRLYFGGGSKITADGDCSHEIKRCLLLGRKFMTNLDRILKSRDITLPTKVHLVKAMAFPVVLYGCESQTVKKTEHWKIDAFELRCWRRLFRVFLDCKEIQPAHPKGDQSWVFIGRTDAEAETPVLWLEFQLLMRRADSLEKTLMLGWIGGRRRGRQRMRWLMASPTWWTWVWVDSGSWSWTGRPGICDSWGHKESDTTEWLNWTELNWILLRLNLLVLPYVFSLFV